MKILYFTQIFYPLLFGGGEYVFFQWANELTKKGHEVFVITQRLEDTKSHEVVNGINIFRVGSPPKMVGTLPTGLWSNLSFFFASVIKGIQLGLKNKFDLIHSNTYVPVISAQVCSRLLHIPHIVTVHDVYYTSKENFWKDWSEQEGISKLTKSIGPWLEKKIAKTNVKLFHTVSETSKEDLKKMGVTKKIVVIPNSIDVNQYERKGIHSKKQAIFVGRLVFYKNVEILIDAFSKVVEKIPNAKLIIVGVGPSKRAILEKTKSLGLANSIIFKGTVSDEEKINLIYQSQVLLNSSLVEGFGMVVLEAFSCAKPVIVSDIKPLSDLVSDSKDGFVVSASDPSQWAARIIQLMSNSNLVNNMGKAGLDKVISNYSQQKIIHSLIELYNSVVKIKDI